MISVEITRQVVSYLLSDRRFERKRSSKLPPYWRFVKYMRISRLWCQLVAEQIWYELHLVPEDGLLSLLMHRVWGPGCVSSSPQMVKKLTVEFPKDAQDEQLFYALLDRLSNVHTIEVAGQYHKLHDCPRVVQGLSYIRASQPKLRHFSLRAMIYIEPEAAALCELVTDIVKTRALRSLSLRINWNGTPSEHLTALVDAMPSSPSLRQVVLESTHVADEPLQVDHRLAGTLVEWKLRLSRPNANTPAPYTRFLDDFAAEIDAFQQLRVFHLDQSRHSIHSTPDLWTLMEALSSLPHLTTIHAPTLLHVTLVEPPRILTFAKVTGFDVRCQNPDECTPENCGQRYFARFKWPSLQSIHLVQDQYMDGDYDQLYENAPCLRKLMACSTSREVSARTAFLCELACGMIPRGVHPSVVQVTLQERRWGYEPYQKGLDRSAMWALEKAFPNAKIKLPSDWNVYDAFGRNYPW